MKINEMDTEAFDLKKNKKKIGAFILYFVNFYSSNLADFHLFIIIYGNLIYRVTAQLLQ